MHDDGGEVEITFEKRRRIWAGFIMEDHREGRICIGIQDWVEFGMLEERTFYKLLLLVQFE